MKNVLALITHGVEEIEAVTPFDLLNRAEIGLTIAALGATENLLVRGRSGLEIKAHATLESLAGTPDGYATLAGKFDALLLPGGPSSFDLLKDGRAALLASAFNRQGKLIAAICAAPLILSAAGILDGKRVAAHSCAWETVPAAKNCARVELDGNVLTSRGPATAFDFGLALVEALAGKSVASRIAAETMA
ncbi:MAG: DJ-1/PfpI family protein [Opitutales bacterium]|nr:DJ-1/PfpI family protein [Opitutales bacterium]